MRAAMIGELYTSEQMRAAERAAISAGVVSGLALMERAGAAVAAAAADWIGGGPGRAVILCGPGNNGGDGYVVARLLAERGWVVDVFALGEAAAAPPDAARMRALWEASGSVRPFAALPAVASGADVMIDALFGAGLTRGLPAEALDAMDALEARDRPAWAHIVAVDGPSGLCLDSGRPRGAVRPADLTVTFHRPRAGHYLASGPEACGALIVADIGIEGFGPPGAARLFAPDPDVLRKRPGQHKYDHGHVLALAGGVGRGGAARLAARAALRVGAGLVTVGAPGAALIENAARLDAIMLRRVDDVADLRALLEDARLDTVLIGPGLGVGARTCALALAAVKAGCRVVLDADALSSLAEDPGARSDLTARSAPDKVVMTPHWGEFRRLFPALADAYAAEREGAPLVSRLDIVARAAAEARATVLLKGADTVIAAPGETPVLCAAAYERVAPWLATAGSGDVLAGMIAGLMARGLRGVAAAATGAWLHQEAARAFGPGLIAEDLSEMLPRLLPR